MNPTRTDLGDEVEEGIRSDRYDRRHSENKNQDGQQKHTAAHPGHTDQSTDDKADQDFFEEHAEFRTTPP